MVIVGGGVIGTSCAFHLAEAGIRDVVLAERSQLGSGSSSRAAGGVRAQFSDEINIELGQRSLAAFADFARRPGWEIGMHRVGYLFVLTHEEDVEAFARSVALQNRLGVPSRMVDRGAVQELCPPLRVDDVLCGAFSPSDGHATPDSVVQGYAAGARALGAHLETDCDVLERARRGRRNPRDRHEQRDDRDPSRRVCGGRVVARLRGAGGRGPSGDPLAPPGPVHRADAGVAGAVPDDDRLRHQFLLPPGGARRPDGHGRAWRADRLRGRRERRLDPRLCSRSPSAVPRRWRVSASRAAGPGSTR